MKHTVDQKKNPHSHYGIQQDISQNHGLLLLRKIKWIDCLHNHNIRLIINELGHFNFVQVWNILKR